MQDHLTVEYHQREVTSICSITQRDIDIALGEMSIVCKYDSSKGVVKSEVLYVHWDLYPRHEWQGFTATTTESALTTRPNQLHPKTLEM